MREHEESSSSTTKTIISSLPQRLWLLTRQNGELLWGATTYKVTWPRDRVVFGDHGTKQNHYVPTTTLPMVTKLDRVVPYLEALLSKIWHDSWITWSSKITWQIKTLYLHYHNACGQQSGQDGDLSRVAPTHNVLYNVYYPYPQLSQDSRPLNLTGCWL